MSRIKMSKRTTQSIPLWGLARQSKDLKEALNYETALTYGLEKVESGAPITPLAYQRTPFYAA